MADSEIELDAETDDDELKKKKQKVLQKYLPGYQIKYPAIWRSSMSDNHVLYADAISVSVTEALAMWRNT